MSDYDDMSDDLPAEVPGESGQDHVSETPVVGDALTDRVMQVRHARLVFDRVVHRINDFGPHLGAAER